LLKAAVLRGPPSFRFIVARLGLFIVGRFPKRPISQISAIDTEFEDLNAPIPIALLPRSVGLRAFHSERHALASTDPICCWQSSCS
jgi:hypothetical protein